MAIAFARVSIHSRSKGHSAVAASAYRTASKLFDERIGTNYDFSNRSEVVFSEILLPQGASQKFLNREFLWNEVERVENRINSQLCKDVVLALPKELNRIQHIELARRFAQLHFVENGLVCDVAIHDGNDGNPHAHILVTLRRIEGNQFSKYKARDLNPQFAKGLIVEGDYWHEQWRKFQNTYFQEKNIDLAVDLNHLICERHAGRIRDERNHYLHEENELIREARKELALHDLDNLINQISLTNSVFTHRDIERLLFKTLRSEINSSVYLAVVERLLAHKDVIHLGVNQQGIDSYTTRHQYLAEAKLLANVEQLQARRSFVFNNDIEPFIQDYCLNEEQKEAFSFITQGENISVLIGRPGVGKSYLLKPLKEYYETNHCRVIGAALSGKVAKALQADTGIESSTIASLTYRLNKQMLKLTNHDVLVIDEAGMVDFANMAYLLDEANKAKCKVILVGDPDQLKPIQKGEIFRGIAEHTGYIELDNIRRQKNPGDKQASLDLAKGKVDAALTHYVKQDAVHLEKDETSAQQSIVSDWINSVKECELKNHVMLAFTRKTVSALNDKARKALQEAGKLGANEYSYYKENSEREIKLAVGERILLRQNDKNLGVRNGDLATIIAMNDKELTAVLDGGEKVTIPKYYKHIDYGYALTVHKSQGMTVDKASVLIDSKYWDRNLSFVAMTRHREKLALYTDKNNHSDLNALSETLSRTKIKDNVIDWPLDYVIRVGFNPDKLIGQVVNRIADIGRKVKHHWNYLVHYEAYLKTQEKMQNQTEREKARAMANELATYFDNKAELKKEISNFEKEGSKETDKTQSPIFDSLYNRTIEMNKKAYELFMKVKEQPRLSPSIKDKLQQDSERYERYMTIKTIAELSSHTTSNEESAAKALSIDLKKDYIHIVRLSSQNNKKPTEVAQQIENLQKKHQQQIFNQLKTTYPILAEYEHLHSIRKTVTGFKAEQLAKTLEIKSKEITDNKELFIQLKEKLPHFINKLKILSHQIHTLNRG